VQLYQNCAVKIQKCTVQSFIGKYAVNDLMVNRCLRRFWVTGEL